MNSSRDSNGSPHRADRKFGQNFLANAELAQALVAAFEPQPQDVVVEIGPGKGALTRELANEVERLVALELDERLIAPLQALAAEHDSLEVRHADAAAIDWNALGDELGKPVRVIGNLPFNAGTRILRGLLTSDRITDMQLMLQLEVALRVLAPPETKAYGPLTVLAALRCRSRLVRKLNPGAFRPMPKVSAGVIELSFRPDPLLPADEIDAVERWLFRGFAQRRKTLANNLADRREFVEKFLVARGLPTRARAEQVAPEIWLDLARALND